MAGARAHVWYAHSIRRIRSTVESRWAEASRSKSRFPNKPCDGLGYPCDYRSRATQLTARPQACLGLGQIAILGAVDLFTLQGFDKRTRAPHCPRDSLSATC